MSMKLIRKGRNLFSRLTTDHEGSVLVEYGLLIAGVALISMVAISVLGHKTSDLFATVAAILPGSHQDDNHPIQSGHLIETAVTGDGAIAVSPAAILAANGTSRLDANVFGNAGEVGLVTESGGNLSGSKGP